MIDHEEEIAKLKLEIEALKREMELHWQVDERKDKEIRELQEKQHKEVLKKQEEGFYRQKMVGLVAFITIIGSLISGFVFIIKKLREAKEEVKKLLKNGNGTKKVRIK